MPESMINRLITDKGFGFIQSLDDSSDYFFHMSYLAKSCVFADLKEGDVVSFELRPSQKKPGQKEAFDIRTTQHTHGAGAPKHHAVDQGAQMSRRTVLPYGFVPIASEHSLTDIPVWHDGSSGGELLSGEILCELEALTPLLPGNDRYPVSQMDQPRLQQWGFDGISEKKQIAEPLRLPDGCVIIAGSALKGMIRQSLGALTDAPMERVGERHFTYRPNLDFNSGHSRQTYVVRPARVIANRDGGFEIEVFSDARSALFVRQDALNPIQQAARDECISGTVAGVEIQNNRVVTSRRSGGANNQFQHRLASYKGGIDGQGLLAAAFNDDRRGPFTYTHALVPQKSVCALHLDAELYRRYLDDQRTVHADNRIGHLAAHPLSHKERFDGDRIAKSICQHCEFEVGQLIYVEVMTDNSGQVSERSKVVSCGHHFRYRWAYTSSVRKQDKQLRPCLTPLRDEETQANTGGSPDQPPQALSGARLLFGYVRNDETNPIGKGVYERLAGRIAINHAISDKIPRFLGSPDCGYCVPLKILGQPKPSAWEFYLQQPKDPGEALNTYGDLPGDAGGALAGRKYYRHQIPTSLEDIKATDPVTIDSEQATLARFICQPGTRFRFTLRFARLRPWELGALLAVLEPHRLASENTADGYAHKLGLGRPLGMGSVRILRQALRLRQERETTFMHDVAAQDEVLDNAMQALGSRLNDARRQQWLDAHRVVTDQRLGYPLADAKVDGQNVRTVYAWHTKIRKEYSKLRRQKDVDWTDLSKRIGTDKTR